MKLQQICLRTWYHSIRHASWSVENQREKLLDRCPSIRHANLNCETLVGKAIATLSMQHTCLLVKCHSMAMSLQLQQTCLLVECYARCVLAEPLLLKQYACRSLTTQSFMHAGVVPLYLPYLLVWCLTISRTCWCGASL